MVKISSATILSERKKKKGKIIEWKKST